MLITEKILNFIDTIQFKQFVLAQQILPTMDGSIVAKILKFTIHIIQHESIQM